jgi:hypothetical protein
MFRGALLFALAACAATAGPIQITITGIYPDNIIGTAAPFSGTTFILQFTTDTNPPVISQGVGYEWFDLTATYSSGAVSRTLPGYAGYFSLGWGQGLDVRLADLDVVGDQLQVIVRTPTTLYNGTPANPTILILSADANGGAVNYYPDPGTRSINDPVSLNYTVSSIPEPGTVWLFLLPLSAVIARKWHRAAPTAERRQGTEGL